MGGKKKKSTIGHRYFMGVHMALGRGPYDEIVGIRVGDKTAWQGSITGNTEVYINKPDLFGGEEKEGGIVRCRTGSSKSSDSLNLKTTSTENFPLNSDTYRLFKSF